MLIFNHRVQKLYGTKLKELKQKRILAKLKKINEKRRRYHIASTEEKIPLSVSDNSVVNNATGLTSGNSTEDYKGQKKTILLDTSERSAETQGPKNASSNVSDEVAVTHEAMISQDIIPTTTIGYSPDGKASNNENLAKVSGVIKLCGSPVRMKDAIKEEIHKLLQEEESRNTKTESVEKSSKMLKIQSNFEAGLLNLHSPDWQRCPERHSSASPVGSNTLSTSNSSAVFMSPPISKTVSKSSEIVEESDDDDDDDENAVSKELKMLDAIVASKHEEELIAKKSRERMLKAYSVEKSNMVAFGGTKKSLIDYATAEMSPMVWHGLIEERRKKWLVNHSLLK